MQGAERSMASRTDRVAELKRELDVADADESQGEWFLRGHLVRELTPIPYNMYA